MGKLFTCSTICSLLTLISASTLPTISSASKDDILPHYPKAAKIVSEMSLQQKIGQMVMPTPDLLAKGLSCTEDFQNGADDDTLIKSCGINKIKQLHIGALVIDGNYMPFGSGRANIELWQRYARLAQHQYDGPEGTELLIGTDSVHGNQHVANTVLFPHNIGLGATHNPELVRHIGMWTAHDMLDSGANWSYSPAVSIAKDYRWGRTYESFSDDPAVVKSLAQYYVNGLQINKASDTAIKGVLSTTKHFLGDGATELGRDEGNVVTDNVQKVWDANISGYQGAVAAHTASIMASYNSINDQPMHFGGVDDLVMKLKRTPLVGKQLFSGFIVSDYNGVTRAEAVYNANNKKPLNYTKAMAKAIDAGVDMFMLGMYAVINPFAPPQQQKDNFSSVDEVINTIQNALKHGLITQAQVDSAVTRIIATKLALQSDLDLVKKQITVDEQTLAVHAVEQSLVLLKNTNAKGDAIIPIKPSDIENVVLLGYYDDIGMQNGGWSMVWQGQMGNNYWSKDPKSPFYMPSAVSVLDGIKAVLGNKVNYHTETDLLDANNDFSGLNSDNTMVISVLAEFPYAEYMGDVDNGNPWFTRGAEGGENPYYGLPQRKNLELMFTQEQAKVVSKMRSKGIPIITILFSGRPVVITEGKTQSPYLSSDALIAAWLPGTAAGTGIAESIFGNYHFRSVCNKIEDKKYCSNTLPFAWPMDMEGIRNHEYLLFQRGFGLKT